MIRKLTETVDILNIPITHSCLRLLNDMEYTYMSDMNISTPENVHIPQD